MKKFIFMLIFMASTILLNTSCISSMYAYEDGNVDMQVVLRTGTRHYYDDGRIMYYLHNGWYYYPYIMNNTVYYYRYSAPIRRHFTVNHRFSPSRNDRPIHRQYITNFRSNRPTPPRNNRPNIVNRPQRPNGGNINRPNVNRNNTGFRGNNNTRNRR